MNVTQKQNDGSAVVSVLGYEHLEPGFESWRPESDLSSTQLN